MYNTKTSDIIKFLTERFKSGASYGTLNATHSAIALISSYSIHEDGLISRFLKGTFKKRPTKSKYATTWDTALVVTFLENLHPPNKLKLKEALEKISTLLALATAHRLQPLALISIENISVLDSEILIKIPDLIKTFKGPFNLY